MKTPLVFALAILPLAVQADPQPAVAELMHYMAVTEHCFDNATDSEGAGTCVGQGAARCMDNETDGYSTVGMMFCTLAEYEAWDRLLNRDYVPLMDDLRQADAQTAEQFPEFANLADTLRDAQRAWIPYRDGQCAFEYSIWREGSMRQIAGASCLLDITAARVIYLRFFMDQIRG